MQGEMAARPGIQALTGPRRRTAAPVPRRTTTTTTAPPSAAAPPVPRSARRDVALDLVRGLAMVILVINHVHLESALEAGTRALLSAAEVLVLVSGVVVGMVFGRRWLLHGARATTAVLLRRSRKLYVASVVVVALVGMLTLVPGAATEVLTVSPRVPDRDLYAFDGPVRTLLAILTLEAGPWQFNILGFFVASLAVAPAILWALARGWWPVVLVASWTLYVIGRETGIDVLPSQSERPFPLLVWQALLVHGMVLGWYRNEVARLLRAWRGTLLCLVLLVAAAAVSLRLNMLGYDPLGLGLFAGYDAEDWERWQRAYFHKASLDPLRLAAMVSITAALYLGLRRFESVAERTIGKVLLPLGRNSFYVFIMHVFVCLAVASVPALAGAGPGPARNVVVQLGVLAVLWVMVTRRFLFRWVPR